MARLDLESHVMKEPVSSSTEGPQRPTFTGTVFYIFILLTETQACVEKDNGSHVCQGSDMLMEDIKHRCLEFSTPASTSCPSLSRSLERSGKTASVPRARFIIPVSPCLYWRNHMPFCAGEEDISTERTAGISNPSGSEVAPGVKWESSGH